MPTPVMKSLAKRAGKAVKEVERLWNKAKTLAAEKGIAQTSKKYYPYAMGILNNMLGLAENKLVDEINLLLNDIKKEGSKDGKQNDTDADSGPKDQ